MINAELIKELETPVELERNIVNKQGFKSLIGIILGTGIAGAVIWYLHKDDIEKAEQHKEVLDVEYVDDTGTVIPKHLVESADGTHMLDIDKESYVDHKTKKKRKSSTED